MSELKLPFARRISDGALTAPEEVSPGLACQCVCPKCGLAVQSKQGSERIWQFAHCPVSDCEGAYESSVHEAAEEMLRERRLLLLLALVLTVSAVDAFSRLLQETETALAPQVVVLVPVCMARRWVTWRRTW